MEDRKTPNSRYAEVRQRIIDGRVLKIIAAQHPDLIAEAQNNITPLINDLILIKEIYEYVCLSYHPKTDYTHKLYFIASILRLFNPDALIIDCKLRNGLRSSLANCLGDSGPNSSYYIDQARAYMKIKAFKATVTNITEQYLNQMSVA